MTVTTNELGQQNMFAREPQMYVSKTDAERYAYETHAEKAEKLNGRTAMIGFFFALFSYTLTGNLYFGLFWYIIIHKKMGLLIVSGVIIASFIGKSLLKPDVIEEWLNS